MALFEVKAEIPAAGVEAADEVLLDLGVEGWSILEDAIARRAWIVGIFGALPEAELRWAALRLLLPFAPIAETAPRLLPDTDWRNSYKAHFHAWTFGRLHWVPQWERATFRLPVGHAVLWLDPGLAFGTGNHETTRLCIERLVALDDCLSSPSRRGGGRRVIDAGCGSGILALSAALLGFEPVAAFDNDPEAIRVSLENAALNRLEGRVDFFVGDLTSGLGGRSADVVLANIQSDILMRHGAELVGAVAPAGCLILSGILAAELPRVRAAFAALVPAWPVSTRTLGEWSDLTLLHEAPLGRPRARR